LEVAQEAEFYGSMDGASKFVRGDAIAGLLILFINLIGGMAVGIFQHGMTFGDAGKVYALLTIGDGLVAQLPSLLLSTAAAIMVTRASGSEDMGKQINRQMFASPKALAVSAGLMAVMGLVPGMPHFSFLSMAALAAGRRVPVLEKAEHRQGRPCKRSSVNRSCCHPPSPRPGNQGAGLG
jgi:flagellar biosynthesis protein FlhA